MATSLIISFVLGKVSISELCCFTDAIFQLKEQELGRCVNGSDKTQVSDDVVINVQILLYFLYNLIVCV